MRAVVEGYVLKKSEKGFELLQIGEGKSRSSIIYIAGDGPEPSLSKRVRVEVEKIDFEKNGKHGVFYKKTDRKIEAIA